MGGGGRRGPGGRGRARADAVRGRGRTGCSHGCRGGAEALPGVGGGGCRVPGDRGGSGGTAARWWAGRSAPHGAAAGGVDGAEGLGGGRAAGAGDFGAAARAGDGAVVVLRGRGQWQGLRGRGRRQRDLLGRRLRQGLRGRGLRLHGHVLRLEGVPRVHVQSLLLDAPHARVRAGVLVVPGRRAGGGRQRQLLLHVVRPAARRLPVRPEAGRADVLLVAALARVGALVGVQPLVKLQVDELGELGGAQITGVRLLTRV